MTNFHDFDDSYVPWIPIYYCFSWSSFKVRDKPCHPRNSYSIVNQSIHMKCKVPNKYVVSILKGRRIRNSTCSLIQIITTYLVILKLWLTGKGYSSTTGWSIMAKVPSVFYVVNGTDIRYGCKSLVTIRTAWIITMFTWLIIHTEAEIWKTVPLKLQFCPS